ncbi:hypothetical protein [Mesobacillus foraminis]|uniref:Uncharacterized protein n=1 Tax=Mesobacillus foraminis TaxID=279826 RepID=A0A4R2BI26_9BACI|nr:hypothetical protein [Mesobacillus foraminis]TCN26225.1 hypothetical protein EV146_104335 [Mesobacillus foraminis]
MKIFKNKYKTFLLFTIIVVVISYLLVYKAVFLPNGYDIISQQNNSLSIKEFNLFGVNKGTTNLTFSHSDDWKIDELEHEVSRYKEFLWILLTGISIFAFLLLYTRKKDIEWRKATMVSLIIFTILLPSYYIVTSLNRIHQLIS